MPALLRASRGAELVVNNDHLTSRSGGLHEDTNRSLASVSQAGSVADSSVVADGGPAGVTRASRTGSSVPVQISVRANKIAGVREDRDATDWRQARARETNTGEETASDYLSDNDGSNVADRSSDVVTSAEVPTKESSDAMPSAGARRESAEPAVIGKADNVGDGGFVRDSRHKMDSASRSKDGLAETKKGRGADATPEGEDHAPPVGRKRDSSTAEELVVVGTEVRTGTGAETRNATDKDGLDSNNSADAVDSASSSALLSERNNSFETGRCTPSGDESDGGLSAGAVSGTASDEGGTSSVEGHPDNQGDAAIREPAAADEYDAARPERDGSAADGTDAREGEDGPVTPPATKPSGKTTWAWILPSWPGGGKNG